MLALIGVAAGPAATAQNLFSDYYQKTTLPVQFIASADMDSDGNADAILSSIEGTNPGIEIIKITNGTVVFEQFVTQTPVTGPLAITDINLDGTPDIVTGPKGGSHLYVFASGSGIPQMISFPGPGTLAVATGDLNADGRPDIAATRTEHGQIAVFKNLPGSISAAAAITLAHPAGVAMADFNGDGHQDLVVSRKYSGIATLPGPAAPTPWIAGTQLFTYLGNSQFQFGSPVVTNVESGPDALAVADMNQDGSADLVSTHSYLGFVAGPVGGSFFVAYNFNTKTCIQTGSGSGSFTTTHVHSATSAPHRIAIADLNLDGKSDIALASQGPTESLQWLAGNGAGGVSQIISYSGPEFPAICINDFNLDGKQDEFSGDASGLLFFKGLGNSQMVETGQPAKPLSPVRGIVPADVNRDGRPDLVTLENATESIAVRLQAANGTFGVPIHTAMPAFRSIRDAVVTDLDGDGLLDVAALCHTTDTPFAQPACIIFKGSGTGNFTSTSSLVFTPPGGQFYGRAITSTDINYDGRPDLVICSIALLVYVNQGGGVFQLAQTINSLSDLQHVALSDMNFDGLLELFTNELRLYHSNPAGLFGTYTVPFLGQSVQANRVAFGDFNEDFFNDICVLGQGSWGAGVGIATGDGLGGFSGPLQFSPAPGTIGPVDLCISDFDGDEYVDVAFVDYLKSRLFVLHGDSLGGVLNISDYNSFRASRIATADIDTNGRPDLVTVSQDAALGELRIYLNQLPIPVTMNVLGAGTRGCRGTLGISSSSEVFVGNQEFAFIGTNGPASSLGVCLLGDILNPAGVDFFGVQLTIHVNPLASSFLLAFDIFTDVSGVTFAPFPIPNDPSLHGFQACAQFIYVDRTAEGQSCSTALADLVSSPGMFFTIP